MLKTFWRVDPPPVGRYRSFARRAWPTCYYRDKEESSCADIICEDEYIPADVPAGKHAELTIRIADYRTPNGFNWRRLKQKAKSLSEAKDIVKRFLEDHPEVRPDWAEIESKIQQKQQRLFE